MIHRADRVLSRVNKLRHNTSPEDITESDDEHEIVRKMGVKQRKGRRLSKVVSKLHDDTQNLDSDSEDDMDSKLEKKLKKIQRGSEESDDELDQMDVNLVKLQA